jgi:hypothetical protein
MMEAIGMMNTAATMLKQQEQPRVQAVICSTNPMTAQAAAAAAAQQQRKMQAQLLELATTAAAWQLHWRSWVDSAKHLPSSNNLHSSKLNKKAFRAQEDSFPRTHSSPNNNNHCNSSSSSS